MAAFVPTEPSASAPLACGSTPSETKTENGQFTAPIEGSRFEVNFGMHAECRAKLVAAMEDQETPDTSVILLQGGKTTNQYDSDIEPLFRQESNFQYLFGVREPDCYGAIELPSGRSILFIPRLPAEYAVWMGKIQTTDEFCAKYGVDEVKYVDELDAYLAASAPETVYTVYGKNSDSGLYSVTEAEWESKADFTVDRDTVHPLLCECRVFKTEAELELMRYVTAISCDAHFAVMQRVRPGLGEYQMESVFQHWSYYTGGCRYWAYTAICCSGCTGSVLHYGHAGAPNDKIIQDGDMCLFDMGSECHCYASDVTCSFPANGVFTADQRMVFNAVSAAQIAVFEAIVPGVTWLDMHTLSYRVIVTHLIEAGLLTGSVEECMAANMGAVFMPHGLGHFIGLDTHDVHGYPAGTSRPVESGYRSLRTTRELAAGMVVTVEPGVYFTDFLLDNALANPEQAALMDAEVINRFRGFGGVRLEDDVIVTEDGCENMSCAARTVEDVEAVMAGRIKSKEGIPSFKRFYHNKPGSGGDDSKAQE